MLTSPPLSTQPLTFHTPPHRSTKLDCGASLYVVERQGEDFETLTFFFDNGSAQEIHPGETNLMAKVLTRGTEKRSAREFSEEFEKRGCSINARCDRDALSLGVVGLVEYTSDMIALAAECLLDPGFYDDELEVAKQNLISSARMNSADPDWLAAAAGIQAAFNGHPYAVMQGGSADEISQISKDFVLGAHRKMLEQNCYIIAAGPVDIDVLANQLNTHLKTRFGTKLLPRIPNAVLAEQNAYYATRPDSLQTSINIHLPCIHYSHPDYAALYLATSVLGGYPLARLFTRLREERGYTYGAYAHPNIRRRGSSIVMQTSVGTDVTEGALKEIADVVRVMGNEAVKEEEMENARQYLLGSMVRSTETPQQTASMIWTSLHHDLKQTFYEETVAAVQELTVGDLLEVQKRYFSTDNWCIGLCGDADTVSKALIPYAAKIEQFICP